MVPVNNHVDRERVNKKADNLKYIKSPIPHKIGIEGKVLTRVHANVNFDVDGLDSNQNQFC